MAFDCELVFSIATIDIHFSLSYIKAHTNKNAYKNVLNLNNDQCPNI